MRMHSSSGLPALDARARAISAGALVLLACGASHTATNGSTPELPLPGASDAAALPPDAPLCAAPLSELPAVAEAAPVSEGRLISVDVGSTLRPRDRFSDLSVGSDYPGTLIRDDSLRHLKLVRDELGFRYIRFHAIFHDVL